MADLVTLDQAKRHTRLGIEPADEDPDLKIKLAAAQRLVVDYIKQRRSGDVEWAAEVDAWDAETAPPFVLLGVMEAFADMHLGRGDDPAGVLDERRHGLTSRVRSLLDRYRDPALS